MAMGDPQIRNIFPPNTPVCNLDRRFIEALAVDVEKILDRLEAVEELYQLFAGRKVGDKEPEGDTR